jgi:hypothetical protein
MTIRPDVEEIQTTRTEKLLAVVLAAFLLLGAVWTYTQLDDLVRRNEPLPMESLAGSAPVQRLERAEESLAGAQARSRRDLQRLVLAREAYRTALEAKRPARALAARYDAAQARYAAAGREVARARAEVAAARPAASAAEQRAQERVDDALDAQERDAFLARLGLVVSRSCSRTCCSRACGARPRGGSRSPAPPSAPRRSSPSSSRATT